MTTLTLSDILDDLSVAEDGLHRFERRYWISSAHFYEMYRQGLLDEGEHAEDFAEWAGHYKLKQKRQAALEQLSQARIDSIRKAGDGPGVRLTPAEPTLSVQ
jgi:hypothetical protein